MATEWPAVVAAAVRPEFGVGVLYPEHSNLVLFGRPRFIDERVIVRLERDDALELLPDPTTRTLVRILIETGLSAIDARTLPLDALSHDTAGAPYLRYFNHKLGREEPDRCMSAALTGGRLPRGLSSAAATPGR